MTLNASHPKPKSKNAPKLIETVKEATNGTLVIPYKKYQFPNGLTLLVHEDHTDPIVHVDVTYHVGSARELVGRSGFAHFFEHMMFQGSDHVGDDEHFKIIQEAGGTLNGTTNRDRTNYFETLPSNQLETALWLEADRMGFLLNAVTQEKFEVQRATVKNERGQNYDNKPYGLVYEKMGEAMYPFGHPYSWLTIGYIEDLDAATLDDLKNFFLRWYGPNNAVVTVAGDVQTDQVVELVNKYFGNIPAGPDVFNMQPQEIRLEGNRYISYADNIRFPLTSISFPGVPQYHPDEAPLDVLSDILGGGKNSIFYKNFVKAQKAVQATVSNPCSELGGNFSFTMVSLPTVSLTEVHDIYNASLKEFEARGVNADDIQKVKAKMEAHFIEELETVAGKASKLAAYETYRDDANFVQKDLQRYLDVTPEDVMRVYNKYIKGQPYVCVTAYPKGQDSIVPFPDNASRPKTPEGYVNNLKEYAGLSYSRPTDNFDRSKRPEPGANPETKVPDFWESSFSNKIPVLGAELNEVPAVGVQITFKGGHVLEKRSQSGISKLLASMLGESTDKYTTEQMSDELDKLGSTISVTSNQEEIIVEVKSLERNIGATLALLEEKLLRPKFDQADFDRVKKLQLEAIKNQSTQPTVIATNVYRSLLYGKDNILSIPDLGTEETVGSITVDDLKAFYVNQVSANLADVTVVGAITRDEFLDQAAFISRIPNANTSLPSFKPAVKPDATTIYLVNKEGAAQSEIRIGAPGLLYDATGEYYKAGLMNYILGTAFNSRVNMNLREDKGLTYGTRANFLGTKYFAHYTASGGFKTEGTDVAVKELLREIREYKDTGISPEEWASTQSAIGQRDALKYESLTQKAAFLSLILQYGLNKDFTLQQKAILKSLTVPDVIGLAKKYLPDNFTVVVVGDKTKIINGLQATGLPIVELTVNGEVVSQ